MSRTWSTKIRKLRRRLLQNQSPPVALVDYTAITPARQEIPAVVHQLVSSITVPATIAQQSEEFRTFNRDFSFILWPAEKRDQFMATHWGSHLIFGVYSGAQFGSIKADIFRYCVLASQGGYAFDIGTGISGSLSALHGPEATGVVTFSRDIAAIVPESDEADALAVPLNVLSTWGLGFTPQHPFLVALIERIVEAAEFFEEIQCRSPKRAAHILSGPGMVTKVFREYVSAHHDDPITQCRENFDGLGFGYESTTFDPEPRFNNREFAVIMSRGQNWRSS
jgi:mannosyltransferase OCH1-like enzyme